MGQLQSFDGGSREDWSGLDSAGKTALIISDVCHPLGEGVNGGVSAT